MPRDSSGNYTLPAGNPVVTGSTIASSWANTTLNDISTEITDSLDRSGKGGMLAALKIIDGTVSAPGFAFTSEPGTGLYRVSAGKIGLTVTGNQILTVVAAGNIVINTPTSGVPLTINGITGNQVFTATDGTHSAAISLSATAGQEINFGAITNHGLTLFTNNTIRIVVSNAGNVTVTAPSSGTALLVGGTIAPGFTAQLGVENAGASLISVHDTTNSIEVLLGTTTFPNGVVGTFSNHQFDIRTNNTQRISVTAAGNVTINAPASAIPLTINSIAGNAASIQVNTVDGHAALSVSGPAATQISAFTFAQSGQSSWQVYQPASSSDFRIFGNGADRVIITNSGNVTVSAPGSGVTIAIIGIAGQYTQTISGSGTGSGLYVGAGSTSAHTSFLVQNGSQTVSYFLVSGAGGVVVGSPTGGDKGLATLNATTIYQNGTALAASATTDTTNAANISAGTLPAGRMPALTGDVTSAAGTVATTLGAVVTNAKLSGSSFTAITAIGNATALDDASNAIAIGWRDIPSNAQTANYTAVLADRGKGIDMNGASLTATIPANASVAYPVGTVLVFTNLNASNLSIAITTDTMTLAGTTTTGTRTLVQNGMASARKVTTTSWIISGSGLS